MAKMSQIGRNVEFTYLEEVDFLSVIVPLFGIEGGVNMPFDKISSDLGLNATDTWRQKNENLKGTEGITQSRWAYVFPALNIILLRIMSKLKL
ncbi:MAG: hypothetical protein Q4F84_10320 [Fibrobacter sp.]|nr:hypothetical protein [Fibrobacter sp.]